MAQRVPNPPNGANPMRLRLGLASVVVFLLVAAPILFFDLGLSPDARTGFIGSLIGYAVASAQKVYEYFFPQNDQ